MGQQNFIAVDAVRDEVAAATPTTLMISHDGGSIWNAAIIEPYVTRIYDVVVTPASLWLATHEGVFRSEDSGQTWEHVLAGKANLLAVRFDEAGQRLLGVTTSGKVLSSQDGRRWTPAGDPGWEVRRLSVAGGRLLGITAFSGIVAEPDTRARASAGGGGQ
jgi:hypothetical protein